MKRSLLVALVAVAAFLAAALAVGVWAWDETGDAAMPDRIGALAGVAQAASAVAIGVLTVVLAWIGYAALGATRTQAAEAQAANRELRIERELSVLPYLSAEAIPTVHPDGTIGLQMNARNQTPHPALDVVADLLSGPWEEHGASGLDLLHPSPRVREVIGADDLKSFLWHIKDGSLDGVVVLRLRYTSLLGAEVSQDYELEATADKKRKDWFRARQRVVHTTVPGALPIILRFGVRRA